LSRCIDGTKNVAKNLSLDVSIYVALFFNDVKMRYRNFSGIK
jgi:hypothetical protein